MGNNIYFFVGAIVAAVLVVVLRRSIKPNDGYDERQVLIRGNAYKIGFMTVLIFLASFVFLSVVFERLLDYGYIWNSISMFAGLITFSVYSILKDAFFSLKQNPAKYLVICFVALICNSIGIFEVVFGHISFTELLTSHRLLNALCALTFVIVACTIIFKIIVDRKEED